MWLSLSDPRSPGWPSPCQVIAERGWIELGFNPAKHQALFGSQSLDLREVSRATLRTGHVMRWSSDEIVEDFSAQLELLAGDRLVLGLRANPHNRDTLASARNGFQALAAEWGWPLEKLHKEIDKT